MEQFDKVVIREGNVLIYLLETKLGHDIEWDLKLDAYYKIQNATDYWKRAYKNAVDEDLPLRWNELKMWLNRNPNATVEETQQAIKLLDSKKSIQDFNVNT
jgi:hypothetical protein